MQKNHDNEVEEYTTNERHLIHPMKREQNDESEKGSSLYMNTYVP